MSNSNSNWWMKKKWMASKNQTDDRKEIYFQLANKNEIIIELAGELKHTTKFEGKYFDKEIKDRGGIYENGAYRIDKSKYNELFELSKKYLNGKTQKISCLSPSIDNYLTPINEVLKFKSDEIKDPKKKGPRSSNANKYFLIKYPNELEKTKVYYIF